MATAEVFSVCGEARAASIPFPQTAPEDVRCNLIGYENDAVEGMTPPRPQAREHYSRGKSVREPETPYVVEITGKHVRFETEGFPSQRIGLLESESEGIRKLSLNFVKLLNGSKLSSQGAEPGAGTENFEWRDLNPVVTISRSGISLKFVNGSEPWEDGDKEEAGNRDVLWGFLTKYARNIFEAKVKELKLGEKYADVIGTPGAEGGSEAAFENFEDALWNIMRLSVDYAETAFEGWEKPEMTTTPTAEEEKSDGSDEKETHRATMTTIFAYEEPSPFHSFPSQEFEHRRKDVDSIFYGRGII